MSDALAHILIVEDDESVAMILNNTLSSAGYECEVVSCGMAGLERVREHNFDLLVLDVNLPKLSVLISVGR